MDLHHSTNRFCSSFLAVRFLGGVVLTLSRGIDDAANTHNHSWELSTSSHLIISVLMMNPGISGGTYAYRRRASLYSVGR